MKFFWVEKLLTFVLNSTSMALFLSLPAWFVCGVFGSAQLKVTIFLLEKNKIKFISIKELFL
jgi:hypothetical protein